MIDRCIDLTEHMSFCKGTAIELMCRAGDKEDCVDDLEKAIWYLQREVSRIKARRKRELAAVMKPIDTSDVRHCKDCGKETRGEDYAWCEVCRFPIKCPECHERNVHLR